MGWELLSGEQGEQKELSTGEATVLPWVFRVTEGRDSRGLTGIGQEGRVCIPRAPDSPHSPDGIFGDTCPFLKLKPSCKES
jgi:hypothetical protein